MSDQALQVWYTDNEFVIGYSSEDATEICAKYYGYPTMADFLRENQDCAFGEWREWEKDVPICLKEPIDTAISASRLTFAPDELAVSRRLASTEEILQGTWRVLYLIDENGLVREKKTRQLPAAWIAERGRGFIASKGRGTEEKL